MRYVQRNVNLFFVCAIFVNQFDNRQWQVGPRICPIRSQKGARTEPTSALHESPSKIPTGTPVAGSSDSRSLASERLTKQVGCLEATGDTSCSIIG